MTRGKTMIPTPSVDQVMDLSVGIPLTKNVLRQVLEKATPANRRFLADLLTAEHASRTETRKTA